MAELTDDYCPTAIWRYYQGMIMSLVACRSTYQVGRPSSGDMQFESIQTLDDALQAWRAELDAEVTLALTASFEAMLRVDYLERTGARRKDPVTREMRGLRRSSGARVELEVLLDIHKTEAPRGVAEIMGLFKQLLRHRHWLAHGRYWEDQSGITPDPEWAWQAAESLFASIGIAFPA